MSTSLNEMQYHDTIDNYAEDGGPGDVWLSCSFYHEPLHTWIKIDVNKFAISAHMALKLSRTESWNFRPKGDGRSGPWGPLLPERNLTFWYT